MKNTTGLYKHQRDNRGKRKKLSAVAPKSKLVPVKEYEYEKARATTAKVTTKATVSPYDLNGLAELPGE